MDGSVSFGAWLKRRRKALDLTQAVLAARVGVAPTTIEKLEAELRRPSAQTAQRLAEILEIAPGERQAFVGWARGEQYMDLSPALTAGLASVDRARRASRLPPALTSFVGREAELARLRALLAWPDARLITVIGAGGIGKTRLALELARGIEAEYADGIRFVDLTSIGEPALVAPAIAAACDVQPAADQSVVERLAAYFSAKQCLLVLDNFEQVVTAAPLLAELLAAAERLTIVVTSRIVLRLSGEHIFMVPPLALPPETSEPSAEQLSGSEAVRLFVERARAQGADTAGVAELRVIADICRQLDGLPLAIELAAARTRLLSPAALLARMGQRLPLLTGGPRDLPPRQQTVRDTIAWSFELLDPAEQRLLTSLGVFAGGCTVAAAEAICGEAANGSLAVMDGIASLLDKSLLRRQDDPGDVRIRMLETIREFALERAAGDGALPVLLERYARYYLELAVTAERHLRGPEQDVWCDRLDHERRNLRTALDWFVEQRDVEHALQLGAALWWYWNQRGQRYDGLATLEVLLELARLNAPVTGRARAAHAMVTLGAGVFRAAYDEYDHIDHRRAVEYIGQSAGLFRWSDDRWGLAWALAYAVLYQPDHEQATAWIEKPALVRGAQRAVGASVCAVLWSEVAVQHRSLCGRRITPRAGCVPLSRARRQLGDGLRLVRALDGCLGTRRQRSRRANPA